MWQLSEAIDGMAEACRAFGIPVIGGNVSLYNESRGRDIDPTPVVGVLGMVDRLERRPPGVAPGRRRPPRAARRRRPTPSLAGSRLAARRTGSRGWARSPPLDLDAVAAHGRRWCATLVADGLVAGAHDVAEGGLGVAPGRDGRRSRRRRHRRPRPRPRRPVLRVPRPGRAVPSPPTTVAEVVPAPRRGGRRRRRASASPAATASSVKGLLDVGARRRCRPRWRDRLPDALGHGTTQG